MENVISLMIDCSRNAVPNVKFLKDYIDILAKCGYNQLQLYMEDTYKIDGEKYFGYFRGAYSKEELQEIDEYAYSKGIEVVPAIQVLGHLASIFYWGEYKQVHDMNDCLLVGEEKTYELIDKMIGQMSKTFRTNKINIGMDESFYSGRGEYLKRFGYRKADDIFLEHLNRVSKILEKYNRQGIMWGDMFYRNMNGGEYYTKTPIVSESAKKLIPHNVDIVYWDYYNEDKEVVTAMAKSALNLKSGAYFAGGVWSWIGFMPRNDFAILQSKIAVPTVKEAGIKQFINTLWGDNGAECSKLSCLPSIYYFAQLVKGIEDEKQIKENFKKTFDIDFDELVALKNISDLDDKPHAINNVSKYMFYSDPMVGIYDFTVDLNKSVLFTKAKDEYLKNINDKTFGYIFKTAADLSAVLEIKYGIGVRIRKAYKEKNVIELKEIIKDLDELQSRIDTFFHSLKNQWYKENKLEGFEILTNRIGGLLLRCKETKELLQDFIDNKISNISCLDQEVYVFDGMKQGEDICVWSASICASVNVH